MILHGSIDRFSVASILQFLAQNTATGVLEVSNYEERGTSIWSGLRGGDIATGERR